MTVAERYAIRVLVDRATRAKLQGHTKHGARLHGSTVRVEPTQPVFYGASVAGTSTTITEMPHDEQLDVAKNILSGVTTRGHMSPSELRKRAA